MMSDMVLSSIPKAAVSSRESVKAPAAADGLQKSEASGTASGALTSTAAANGSQAGAAQRARPAASEVLQAVSDVNELIQTVRRDLVFQVDDSTHEVVVKVTDRDSGEVVRQIPSEAILKLRKQLSEIADRSDKAGLLIRERT